ncbi:tetratricopeptide repeat protein [Occallatibacter riparius]|uniref:Tetratricopeptide repeat protein n=1 Tax=Occallatibacter riparius TaxID=1002689 RepID=A0A9J7BUP1_9BACT|nr:tetratricopeptide repeat protein [Occallatibacter riparius]UWZ86596.1 tetratricopeptide repeat protein [Occallatibacter riparius]
MKARWIICVLAALWMTAPLAPAWQQDTFAITGVVHDGAGKGVAGAAVRLQAQGDGHAQELKTDGTGSFGFAGLKAGVYVVSAHMADAHSNEVTVRGTGGAVQRVELTLGNGASGGDKNAKTPEMEFSDAPNFTVAGVTDWTAAGGHGSDTTLRASESLTRETLQLKAEPKGAEVTASRERQLREAVAKSPRDYKANEELGRFYLHTESYAEAVVPLQTAFEVDPTQKEAEYELALALFRNGDAAKARAHVDKLLAEGDRSEWHRLAGEVDEKLGDPLGAVRELERAVKEDPSEENYFAWGTELLEHRAIWQAKDVFESGVRAYPKSVRLLTALGTALFSGAMYEDAAQRLCEASDLSPEDAAPYLFMGRVDIASPNPLPCVETKLKRFVELQPANALANYYYAMAYWKQHGKKTDAETLRQVEQSLNKAVDADAKCSIAYLQLGVIRASQSDYRGAAEFYQKAIDADSLSTEAHYRLGVAYDRLGEKEKAAEEFRVHDELKKQQAAAVEKQRREVKQFLVQVGGDEKKTAQP